MKIRHPLRLGALSTAPALLTLLASACAAPGGSQASSAAAPADVGAEVAATAPVRRGVMPVVAPAKASEPRTTEGVLRPQGSSNTVSYGGGALLSNAHVIPVFWNWGIGVNPTIQTEIGCFYDAVLRSPFIDQLAEYDTPTQSIGRGTTGGAVTIWPHHTAEVLSDDDIQSELADQLDWNALPAPDANTIYMVYFPPGISMTANGGSCIGFCAYHESFSHNGQRVRYGVFPDLSQSGCAPVCGGGDFAAVGTVSSHELAEAITDADPNDAWNGSNGEIGDPCSWASYPVNVAEVNLSGTYYTVQQLWSNAHNGCVAPTGQAVVDAPFIRSVSTTEGPYSSATSITINGSCFADLSGTVEQALGSSSEYGALTTQPGSTFNQLQVSVPPSPAGEVGLATLYLANAGDVGLLEMPFTYTSSTAIFVSPSDGPMQGGTPVTITGGPFPTGPNTAVAVSFGGVPAASVTCTSSTTCVAYPPAHDPGPVTVTLDVEGASETAANSYTFDAPQITSVAPATGPISGNTYVVVEGNNMAATSEISFTAPMTFGSQTVTAVCVREGKYQASCMAYTPALAAVPASPMDIQIQITHTTGTKIWTPPVPADRFTYTLLPAITNFSYPTLTLNGAAPSGGAVIGLALAAGSPAGIIQFPSTATIAAGAETLTVPVTVLDTSYTGSVSILASYGGTYATGTVELTALPPPPPLAIAGSNALPFTAGMTRPLTLTLGSPAPAGGAVVTLTSSSPTRLAIPATVTVPAGATSATVTMTSEYSRLAAVTITATYDGSSSSLTLDVGAPLTIGGGGGGGCGSSLCQ